MTAVLKEQPQEAALSVAGELSDLIEALRFANYAICQDKLRPYLQGVRLDWERGGLRVAATDGHRLHVSVLPYNAPDHAERLFLLKAEDVSALLRTFSTKRSQKGATFTIDYAANKLAVYGAPFKISTGTDRTEHPFFGWQPEDPEYRLSRGARPVDYSMCWCDLHRVIPRDPPPVFTAPAAAFVGFLDAMLGAGKESGLIGYVVRIETTPDPVVKDGGQVVLSGNVPVSHGYSRHFVEIRQSGVEDAKVCKPFIGGYQANYVRDILRAFGERSPLYLMAKDASGPAVWHAAVRDSHRGYGWRVRQDRFVVLMPCRV